jgi:signal peptidase I
MPIPVQLVVIINIKTVRGSTSNNIEKNMGRGLKILYNVFVAFVVVVAVLLIVSMLPITGNIKVLTVLSGSMEPSIKTGSVVVVKPASDYKIDEVITFGQVSKTKIPTTHRIQDIKIEGGQPVYITKGDANNAADASEVQKKNVIGKVLFSVPWAGYAVEFAKKPIGFALIIIIPALVIISDEIIKIIKELKNKNAKVEQEKNK